MKKIVGCFLCIIELMLCCSCSSRLSESAEAGEELNKETLNICILSDDEETVQSVAAFQLKFPTYELEKQIISPFNADAYDKLYMQLMTGNGPDTILNSELTSNNSASLLENLIQNDMLYDLTDVLKQNDLEKEFLPSVLQAQQYSGIYWLYKSVFPPVLLTTKEREEQYGVSFHVGMSISDFLKQLNQIPPGECANITSIFNHLSGFITLTGLRVVDWENKQALVNTTDFKTAMQCYKKLLDTEQIGAEVNYNAGQAFYTQGRSFLEGKAFFLGFTGPQDIFQNIWFYESALAKQGEKLSIYPYPQAHKDGNYGAIGVKGGAIFKNTSHLDAALDLLLRQYKPASSSSVMQSKLDEMVQQVKQPNAILYYDWIERRSFFMDELSEGLSAEVSTNLVEILSTMNTHQAIGASIFALIEMEMHPYFYENASLESCVETLQNKLTLYLNE